MRLRVIAPAAIAALLLLPPLAHAQHASGIDRAVMDTTCSPCRDFYRYANGVWLDATTIPSSYTTIGTMRSMADRNDVVQRAILEGAAANAGREKDPTLRKLGQLYAVLMDSTRADREGLGALEAEFAFIDGITDAAGIQRALERYALQNSQVRRAPSVAPMPLVREVDPKNSAMTIARIRQGGLGLPDRDYYFRTDSKSETQRAAYVEATTKLLVLMGASEADAAARAGAILAFETALAESSMTRVAQRDPEAVYHKIPVRELEALAPTFDWIAFFRHVGLPDLARPDAELDVSMPAFVRQVDAQLTATPVAVWRDYLKCTLALTYAPWLGNRVAAIGFELQRALTGAQEPQPRWKQAIQRVDWSMGEALGKAFVATEFPPVSKKRMDELVTNLFAAYRERMATRTWMSDATRAKALEKLAAIRRKIGYPDVWRDYTDLKIDPASSAVSNLIAADAFEARRKLDAIGRAPDRGEWGMTPQTVNAYYSAQLNEIVFPAGILQPPYFDPAADDAANYGAIGMVIGHEITHGFDDRGSQYDADGNLKSWWTPEDRERFETLADRVVAQYDGYVGVDTLHVNGRLTLGENIADLGGLTMAYHAYRRSLGGQEAPVIDGWSGDQRFFLGAAQAWQGKGRDDTVRQRVLTDPHSPWPWRINGPFSNMAEFRKVFGCTAGDSMVRAGDDQIEIW